MDQLQRELQVFRQRYKFVNPEDQSSKLVEQIQSLETQRIAIEQKLAVARTSYATLLTAEGQQAALNQLHQLLLISCSKFLYYFKMQVRANCFSRKNGLITY